MTQRVEKQSAISTDMFPRPVTSRSRLVHRTKHVVQAVTAGLWLVRIRDDEKGWSRSRSFPR